MRAFICALLCVLLLAGAPLLFAQQFQGGVRGVVRDAEGGVIPGVTVTLINEATNVSRTTVTNERGEYSFANVAPGTYTVRAELSGFAPFTREGLIVGVASFLVQDITLQVGGIEETITVTGETPLIETATASVASAIDKAQLEVLPTPGRNLYIFALTTPNVIHTGDPVFVRQQDQTNASLISLGGGPLRGNNYTIDGVAVTDMRNRSVINPNLEGTEEVKIQVNTYDAEMGRTGGGVFNVLHKSGSNNWSGSGLWQARPQWGRTTLFFEDEVPDTTYNLYAGSFGGPIVRDRTFFWASSEGYSNIDTRNDQVILPDDRMANGDFSGTGRTIYDPLSIDPATGQRLPFPGNVIPPDRIDPVGLKLAQQLAQVRAAAGGRCDARGFCGATASLDNIAYQWTAKIDHSFTDNWQMSGTWMFYDSQEPANKFYTDLMGEVPVFDTGSATLFRRVYVLAINSNHIPNESSILNLRFGWTYFDDSVRNPDFTAADAQSFGWRGDWLNQVPVQQFPYISVSGYGDGDNTHGSWSSNDLQWWSYEGSGTYSQFVGSHTLKYGGQYRRIGADSLSFGNGFQFSFRPDFTQGPDPRNPDPTSGDALAALLLGLPSSGQAVIPGQSNVFVDYFGAFIQDDWRISDDFVLNLGLRIEHETGIKEEENRFTVGFSRDAPFPIQVAAPAGLGDAPGFPLRGGLMYAGVDGNPTHQLDPPTIKLGPRIGFAWSANPDTVIRGGYAVFWAPYAIPGTPGESTLGAFGYTAVTSYIGTFDGVTPVSPGAGAPRSLTDPFPDGILQPTGNRNGLLQNAGDNVFYRDQFAGAPYLQKWSVDFQRELGGGVALKVGYVGSRGASLPIGGTSDNRININQLDTRFLALGEALDDQIPNPFFGNDAFGSFGQTPTLPRGQLLRPFPQFRNVFARHVTNGRSQYNALRVELEKRFRGRWGARINYTLSDQKDNIYEGGNTLVENEPSVVFLTPPGCATGECGELDNDYTTSLLNSRHWFNINGLYRFPSPGGAADIIAGGWSVSVSALFRTGFPLAITQATNNLGSGFGFDHQRPNRTGADPSVSGNTEEIVASGGSLINPAAFENAPAFTPGNTPRTITDARTPKLVNWDISFDKETHLGGDANLHLRFELINIFNGVNWRGPRSVFGLSNFGRITGVRGFPRMFQFMAKITF